MDKHIDALLELRFGCRFDAEWSQEAAEQVAAIDAAIALMRGQSEVVAYIVPVARVTSDGSYEDGPSQLCFADEADDYVRRVGAPLCVIPAPPKDTADEQ